MSEPGKAVFLSYASQDSEAAKRICEALRSAGLEVWFDQSELRGGDAWDAMIRKRIKECALFVPLITPTTNARTEGYFRLEWKLAVDRSHLMADDAPFLFPIVLGDVNDATARVPDKFRDVQWTRLRLDETPAELAGRMARLLSGARQSEAGDRRPEAGREPRRRQDKSGFERWWWLIFPIMGMSVPIIAVLKKSWPNEKPPAASAPAPASSPPPPASAAAPSVSAARQLADRARVMSLDKYDSSIDDFTAAEGLVKKALELDPNDGEIWAVSSLINFAFNSRGFERSPTRNSAARAHAERALKLAPDSVEALFALARWQRDGEEPAIAEANFLKILARQPDHVGALHNLGYLYDRLDRIDEAAALYAREAQNPAAAALAGFTEYLMYFRRARFAEADVAVRKSLAVEPSSNAQSGLALLLLTWKGDADGATAAVASGPATIRREHRPIWVTALAHLCRRQPADALRVLERLTDEYILDNWYTGPKAYWVGLAHAQAGREAAAQVAWEAGLAVVDQRLKNTPADYQLRLARGELLALLGREAEALQEVRTLEQLSTREQIWIYTPVRIHAALGRVDDALKVIEQQLQFTRAHRNFGWPLTPALLRIDPRWDKLRGDPRFQALSAEPVVARDWPKDPELRKAHAIVAGLDATSESCRLAEDMINAVLKQRPTDPEATVVYAMLNNYFLNRGYDASEERFVLARRFAERALQLAPDEPEALAAMGQFLTFRGADYPRAEELIRQAMALAPNEPRFGRILSYNVLRTSNPPKALAQAKANAARFPGDALTHYDLALICRGTGELELMEQALDRAIALAPIGSAMIWKGWLAAWVHGDLPGFKSWLDRISGNFRYNERTVYMRYLYASLAGDAAYGLGAVRSYTGTWLGDFYYTGPRALLLADLLALEGKADLAREEYGRALVEIDRVARRSPEDSSWERAKFWTLHGAGRTDEAQVAAKRMLERLVRPYRPVIMLWWHDPIPAQLLAGERADALALIREAARTPVMRAQIRTALKIDRRMAPFRDDPEIQAMLAEPAEQRTEAGGQKAARPSGGGP